MSLPLLDFKRLNQSILWNLLLLTIGSFLFAFGAQCIAAHHGFLTGGIYGAGILCWYATDLLSPATWYALINIPLFLIAWFQVGRCFFLYSLYATLATIFFGHFLTIQVPIENPLFAAIAAGVICGTGSGIELRTMGSGGGLDVVGVILNRKWNIGIGRFCFSFNALMFTVAGWTTINLDMVIISVIQVFLSASALEYVLKLFNQRKLVYAVTERGEELCEAIIAEGHSGATILKGKGAYSGDSREIIMTVTNNILLRKLETLVYDIDPHALFIVENTFYVSGAKFPRKNII